MISSKFNIVLYEPQIPQNTGNIARLCACTGASLYLVGELGFQITDKHVKRAGLDYWNDVDIHQIETLDELISQNPNATFYYLSTKGVSLYTEVTYKQGDFLVFGSETCGLPAEVIAKNSYNTFKIPMLENRRSLNLSNSVAIVIYEAIRQVG